MEKAQKDLEVITKYFTDLSSKQLKQFAALGDLYHEWNRQINVISRKDESGLYEKHVLHSLSIAVAFDFPDGLDVLDLGTGGGFPGIPLAIFFPAVKFHLADSIGKKIKVVNAIKDELGLQNVTTQHTRGEEIKNKKFEVVVSRAVATMKDLWKWSKPLLKKGPGAQHSRFKSGIPQHSGQISNGLICLKGGDIATEIAESGCRPRIVEIQDLFPEEVFKEKFILQIPI